MGRRERKAARDGKRKWLAAGVVAGVALSARPRGRRARLQAEGPPPIPPPSAPPRGPGAVAPSQGQPSPQGRAGVAIEPASRNAPSPEEPPASSREPAASGPAAPASGSAAEPVVIEGGSRAARRKRAARRRAAAAAGLVAVAGVAALIVASLRNGGLAPDQGAGVPAATQRTMLLVTVDSQDLSQRAESITLLAIEPGGAPPFALFLPTATLSEVPGAGFEPIGKAYSIGRAPLLASTVHNLVGVKIGNTLAMDERAIAALVDAAGGVEIDVTQRLQRLDGRGRLVPAFPIGRQRMDGATAARYFAFRGPDETEIARFVRHRDVLEGLFDATRSVDQAGTMWRAVTNGLETDATPEDLALFLATFAAAGDERTYDSLPVEAVSGGGPEESYRPVDERVQAMVGRFLQGAARGGAGAGYRLEVRNGNGRIDSGGQAARVLIAAGLRLVVSGNAPTFDYARTQIIVYQDDEATLDAARLVRELLGAGEIVLGRRSQTIVDMTVIVGKDYPPDGG